MTENRTNRSALWVRILLAVCAIQFVLLLLLSSLWNRPGAATTTSQPAVFSLTNQEPYYLGKPGPWGNLEYTRINIEPPDQFLSVDGDFEPSRWYFDDYTPDKLAAFFKSCNLPPAQADALLNPASWMVETNGMVVLPGNDLIWQLGPEARARIYSVLSEDDRNEFQYEPYTYRNGDLDDWLGDARISAETMALLKKLIYRRGNSLCFSDLPQLFAKISTTPEKIQLVKTLSRNSTLLMKLRVNPKTDVAALGAYWATGGRSKDILPLLDSLTDVPGSATLDVLHLLPPFARKRVNTYPQPPADPNKPMPNCFWTAMNLFNDPPDDGYLDYATWRADLEKNYQVVKQPTFGDLIFLVRPDDTPIHAAVYIADDVVFTKNGASVCQPWILMRLEDMLARYPTDYPVRMFVFRKKAANP